MSLNSLILPKAILFFTLLPFVSPLPIYSDAQPVVFILSVILLFCFVYKTLDATDIYFIFFAFVSLIYVNTRVDFDVKSYLTPTIACVTFLAIKYSLKYFNFPLLFTLININFFGLMFHYFAPSQFISIFSWAIGRDIKITDTSGVRGASGFAAEPGFTGAVAVVCIAALSYFWHLAPLRDRRFALVMCLIMIIITKSGSGSLLFLLFCFGIFIERVDSRYLYIIPLLVLMYLLYLYFPISRGVSVIELLITNPSYLWKGDTSTGHRVMNIVIGFLSLSYFPFGNGVGSYDVVSEYIVNFFNLKQHIKGFYTNISAFSKLSVEFGFIFIVLIIFLNFFALRRNGLSSLKYLLVANAMIGVSFSFMFPPTWLLYCFALKRRAL